MDWFLDDVFIILLMLLATNNFLSAHGYDPLDPNGNITIRWDVLLDDGGGSRDVRVSIVNNQLFRHIEPPGWRLGWAWPNDDVIWDITGAETTEQGNCSRFTGHTLPHCCQKEPTIIDLLAGAPYNKQVANCCRAGILSSMMQDPTKHVAAFQMNIGSKGPTVPANFTLGIPGYTCGPATKVAPTKFSQDQGRRTTQALETHNVTCTYSQFRASVAPSCCVSLSAFYNTTIVPCPQCSCACLGQPGSSCLKPGERLPVLQLPKNEPPKPLVQCSNHMCPIQVHWHIKQSYKEYWRVKMTVTNLNFVKNYSDWNLVVLHPNLRNLTQVFSFNYKPLNVYGDINDTGIFYGIQYYNDMVLQSGRKGNVQSEMLLKKEDPWKFKFREGWGFPRKVSFNGEECVMPSPDDYPRLPNSAHFHATPLLLPLLSFLMLLA